jgi:hypothetical protein
MQKTSLKASDVLTQAHNTMPGDRCYVGIHKAQMLGLIGCKGLTGLWTVSPAVPRAIMNISCMHSQASSPCVHHSKHRPLQHEPSYILC